MLPTTIRSAAPWTCARASRRGYVGQSTYCEGWQRTHPPAAITVLPLRNFCRTSTSTGAAATSAANLGTHNERTRSIHYE
jgi:hypothetical protein